MSEIKDPPFAKFMQKVGEPLPVVNCKTCAHRDGENCLRSGWLVKVTRNTCNHRGSVCDANFSGWQAGANAASPSKPWWGFWL